MRVILTRFRCSSRSHSLRDETVALDATPPVQPVDRVSLYSESEKLAVANELKEIYGALRLNAEALARAKAELLAIKQDEELLYKEQLRYE